MSIDSLLSMNSLRALCLLLVLLLNSCQLQVTAMDHRSFCESRCAIGKGGNLCKCNAVHFAGKRFVEDALLGMPDDNEDKRMAISAPEDDLLPVEGEDEKRATWKRGTMSDYCYQACAWGRGGNLCRCNAVHFAGKRSPDMSTSNYIELMSNLLYKLRGRQWRRKHNSNNDMHNGGVRDGGQVIHCDVKIKNFNIITTKWHMFLICSFFKLH